MPPKAKPVSGPKAMAIQAAIKAEEKKKQEQKEKKKQQPQPQQQKKQQPQPQQQKKQQQQPQPQQQKKQQQHHHQQQQPSAPLTPFDAQRQILWNTKETAAKHGISLRKAFVRLMIEQPQVFDDQTGVAGELTVYDVSPDLRPLPPLIVGRYLTLVLFASPAKIHPHLDDGWVDMTAEEIYVLQLWEATLQALARQIKADASAEAEQQKALERQNVARMADPERFELITSYIHKNLATGKHLNSIVHELCQVHGALFDNGVTEEQLAQYGGLRHADGRELTPIEVHRTLSMIHYLNQSGIVAMNGGPDNGMGDLPAAVQRRYQDAKMEDNIDVGEYDGPDFDAVAEEEDGEAEAPKPAADSTD